MRHPFYAQLGFVLVGVVMLIGGVGIVLVMLFNQAYVREVRQRASLPLAGQLAAGIGAEIAKFPDPERWREVLERVTLVDRVIEPYILDGDGRVLATSGPLRGLAVERVSLDPIRALLEDESTLPILGEDPLQGGRGKVFSVARLPLGEDREGFLYVVLGGQVHDSVVQGLRGNYVASLASLVGLGALAVGLAAGLLAFFFLTRPLTQLTRAVEGFRRDDFATPLALDLSLRRDGGDEVARIGAAVAEMGERIHAHVEALNERDAVRRELVANVSHDLRTPLAVLRGYVETLRLKDAELDADERARYLAVAHRNVERLDGLIDALFELAKLDGRATPLTAEPFSMAELVQDVVASFTLVAEEGGVDVRFRAPPQLPFVHGEIALIERALVNLIDNALRHTPAGGHIELEVRTRGAELSIEVRDSGPGIPEDEVPHLTERSFQGRGTRPGGSGFGLAIVERILDLHHTELQVTSGEQGGASFRFHLPTVDRDGSVRMLLGRA